MDNGKPIREATYIDLPGVVENFEYFAGWSTKIEGETIPVPGQSSTTPCASRSVFAARLFPGIFRC